MESFVDEESTMTIIPSIIRLFNISTTVVIYSHEISKLLPCQEEQLMLKQFLLIVRIYRRTPYTHLSHCKQFCKFRRQKYKKKKKKKKKRTRSSSKHPFNWLPHSRISAASHYHRYYRAPRRRFPILPQAPRTIPDRERERERKGGRKKN